MSMLRVSSFSSIQRSVTKRNYHTMLGTLIIFLASLSIGLCFWVSIPIAVLEYQTSGREAKIAWKWVRRYTRDIYNAYLATMIPESISSHWPF
jgi:hypothetical protein